MRFKFKLSIFILGFIFVTNSGNVFSAPSISDVSGNIANGETITIAGSGFGAKLQPGPLISSYDSATAGNNWSGGTIGGNWTTGGTVSLINSLPRTSTYQSSYKISYDAYNLTSDYKTIRYDHNTAEDKLYLSFWMYRDNPTMEQVTGGGNNAKFARIYQGSTSDGNIWWTVTCGGGGDAVGLRTSGDGMAAYSGWSIAYTGCSAVKYVSSHFSPNTTICLPSMQNWEHYELYIDYPSTLGGHDGINVVWKDGQTVARSIDIAVNGTGQSNNQRLILVGMASGGHTSHYNQYIDQLYIDNTQAHVFISDASNVTWPDNSSAHHSEIQVASVWSDTSITITVNQGSFAPCETYYLFVVDAEGNVNTEGYPIYLVTGSDEAPCPPGRLKIVQ